MFHRVIDGFMIQGGGFTADLQQKATRAPIPLEGRSNGLKNDKYTIAMARTSDPNSATSQFFINVKDNAMLNAPNPDGHGYTVFGKVVAGTDVVDKIRAARTGNKNGMQDVPVETHHHPVRHRGEVTEQGAPHEQPPSRTAHHRTRASSRSNSTRTRRPSRSRTSSRT